MNATKLIAASRRVQTEADGVREITNSGVRTRVLYNEGLDSDRFFLPGLIGIILQMVTLALTTFAIVRERENGTLEQLFVTPIGQSELLVGKIAPYALVGGLEFAVVAAVMTSVFGVPIAGNIGLLMSMTVLFIVCSLAMGVMISTLAKSQLSAMELAYSVTLPSVLLSGFMYPRSEMPGPIAWASNLLPATHYIEIARGIILKGATLADLVRPASGLLACTLVILALSAVRFRKQLG